MDLVRSQESAVESPALEVQDEDLRLAYQERFLRTAPVRSTVRAAIVRVLEELVAQRVCEELFDRWPATPGNGNAKGAADVVLHDQVRAVGAARGFADQGAE